MGYSTSRGPPIVSLVPARSALVLSGPARIVLRCPTAIRTACPPRTSRPTAASASRSAALRVAPCRSQRVAPYCSQRVALCCPSRRALLPCTARALLPSPPSRPASTTAAAAAAARATAAAGGGAAGSAGNTASAGGAGGATGSAGGDVGAGGATGSAGGAAGAGGGGGFGFLHTAQRRQQCQQETFSPQVLSKLFPHQCVTGSVKAAALGASESAAALGASESAAALGARASPATGPSSAEALHTFTLDSGASRCFFRDCTTLTPLAAPKLVSLADPTGGPIVARASTVLPCPAVPSSSLSGLHLPTFLANLVSNAAIQDVWVDTFIPEGQRVAICTCSRTGLHLATFTRQPGSSLYTLTTASAQVAKVGQVAASSQVSASGQLGASCSCRRAALHSSEFPPITAPLKTLHMDVRGRAPFGGTDQERYFLADDYYRCYTTVFPLRRKADVSGVLIPWIRATRRQLRKQFCRDFPVVCLYSDRGGEFSSDLLAEFYRDEGIVHSFTLPASPQQNGFAERRIGLIMEVARTSMIHAAAPHFVWSFAVRYAAHQLNLWPRVSEPETSPTLWWTGKVGDALVSRVWGALSLVRDAKASKLSSRTLRCIFLGFPTDAPPWQFYHPRLRRTAGAEPGGADAEGEGSGGAASGGAATGGAGSGGAATRGAGSWGAAIEGADLGGPASPSGGGAVGDPAIGPGAGHPPQPDLLETLSPQANRAWIVRRGSPGGGGYGLAGGGGTGGTAGGAGGAAGAGGTRGAAGDGGTGGTAGAGGAGAAEAGGTAGARGTGGATGAVGTEGVGGTACAGGAGAGGTGGTRGAGAAGAGAAAGAGGAGGATGATGTGGAGGTAGAAGAGGAGAAGLPLPLLCPPIDQSEPQLLPGSPLPVPAPHTEVTESLTEHRELETRASTPVQAHRVACPRPPAVPGTHGMALRPSSVPQRVILPGPPASSLPHVPDPESDLARTATFPLVTELVDFAARSHLDYVASLVTEFDSVCPPSVGGELALGSDVLEDRQFELECLVAALPRFASILLCLEGDPDALDIPTPRSYAEVIAGKYSSQWETAMDAEMACWKSTGTYVDKVPPPGVNIVDGMWIFKARFVARGFSQRQGVDFFLNFYPTPKMTTLRVLLHVAAHRDYELHSLDFSRAFLQGSLHEEIWLRRPPGFIGSFPVGAALGFAPSSADPSLFQCTDATLAPFYVLVYVLQRFGFQFSSPKPTPLSTGHSLSAPPSDESVEPSGLYPELVGCLMSLMTCTRPDLAYPLSLVALYLAPGRHRKVHWDAAKRVLRYLCSTSGMGLMLGGQGSLPLTGHFNASWADDLATQRSSQGYTFSLGSGSVSWRSTRFSSVLGSSCEAEIYAGAMATYELRWLTYPLIDLGERPRSPLVLYVDNKAMLALCHEQRPKHRMKHIALRYFLARELQQRRQLRLSYVASRADTADVFTKALGSGDHQRFCIALGLVPTLPHLVVA
ncbi:unnamed protein product [Closterium sp. NIES-53]